MSVVSNALKDTDMSKMTVSHCAVGNSKDRCEQFCLKLCVEVNGSNADLNFTAGFGNLNVSFQSQFLSLYNQYGVYQGVFPYRDVYFS